MSGVFSGRVRGHVNYRALYASLLQDNAYETFAAGADIRFTATRKDMASFNFSAVQDRAGVNGYSRTFAAVGGSFIKLLDEGGYRQPTHYLVAGAQAGFGQYKIDNRELWFSNQYDGLNQEIAFDRDSGEPIGIFTGDPFLDINAGLMYYLVGEDRLSGFLGGALHHVNQPDISFFDTTEEERLYLRWTVHAGGEVPLGDKLSFLPGAAYMQQGPGSSLTMGGNFRYSNWERWELALRAGPWFHFSNQLDQGMLLDAFAIAVVFELERWNLGVSYDVTTSALGRSNYARGAMELSLTYFMPGGSRYKVECPEY